MDAMFRGYNLTITKSQDDEFRDFILYYLNKKENIEIWWYCALGVTFEKVPNSLWYLVDISINTSGMR
jgi:hypothetical protein